MLQWALAGVGDIAQKRVLPAILAEPRSRLRGVVTRDEAKGLRWAKRAWSRLEDAIADKEVDALYVATPVALHAPQTIAALRAGKHVLTEKPVAMNYGEACRMVETARECGRILGVAYYRRTYPKVRRGLQLIEQGVIGRPVLAEISCHDWFQAEDGRRGWLLDPSMAGGGPLYDIASHRIDLLNYFFGQPRRVRGLLSRVVHQAPVEDAATALIDYGNGVRGIVDVRWHCRESRDEFRITGTEGVIDLTPLNGGSLTFPGGREDIPPHPNLHYPCVENFVSAVLDGAGLLAGESSIWTDWVTAQIMADAA